METLGQKLKAIRTERGLRLQDVADRAHMDRSTISLYESDARTPSVPALRALAEALNVPAAWLLGDEGKAAPLDTAREDAEDAKEFARRLVLLRKERKLSQAQLAEKTQVPRSALALYETGAQEPELATVKRLADFFNVSVLYLLGRTPLRSGLRDTPTERPATYPMPKAALESPAAPTRPAALASPPAPPASPADLPRLMREAGLREREVKILMDLVNEFLARRTPGADEGPGQPGRQ